MQLSLSRLSAKHLLRSIAMENGGETRNRERERQREKREQRREKRGKEKREKRKEKRETRKEKREKRKEKGRDSLAEREQERERERERVSATGTEREILERERDFRDRSQTHRCRDIHRGRGFVCPQLFKHRGLGLS